MSNRVSKLTFRSKKIDNNFTSLPSMSNGFHSYGLDEYRDKVTDIINSLGDNKDDRLFLKKIYTDLSPVDISTDNFSIDSYKSSILSIIDDNVIEGNKDFFTKFAKYLMTLGAGKIGIEEIDPLSLKFSMLTHFSKKKSLVNKLLQDFPNEGSKEQRKINKQKRKEKLIRAKKVGEADGMYESLDAVLNSNNDIRFYQLLDNVFGSSLYSGNQDIIELYNGEYRGTEKDQFIAMLKEAHISEDFIQKFLDEDLKESNIINPDKNSVFDSEKVDGLINFEPVNRRNVSDFNPLLVDLSLDSGLKLFSFERFKDIYKYSFQKIASDILLENGGKLTSLNSIFKIDTNYFISKNDTNKKEQKNSIVYQYLLEWDLDDSFTKDNLKDIAILINSLYDDVNMNSSMEYKRFSHPIQTTDEALDFRGFFDESGSGFEGDYIIETKSSNKEKGVRKLRLCLNQYTQDTYIYLMTQIGYYINHKRFIDSKQLYSNIYFRYTQEMVAGEKLHDISIFEDKYSAFMDNIILPLSTECRDLGIKPKNTVLTGPYGTGKSQFLLNLLANREFEYKGKIFHLNANVIDINVGLFEGLLMNDFGGLRTKLDEIYQNTGLPIILVIEDFETILNEKLHGVNDKVAQKLTTTLEGIGSLPVTIISSTNNPERIPERLIRPNRFSNIIPFFLPSNEEKKVILISHLGDKGIELSKDIVDELMDTRLFKKGTASHISEFVQELKNTIDRGLIFGDTISLTSDIVIEIANSINISLNDLENIIKSQKNWLEEIKGSNINNTMGFKG